MPFALNDGVNLFYTDEGVGARVVLFVHGWGCDSHDWSWQIPAFVEAGYRVLVPDLRGYGRASAATHGQPARGFANDLAGLLDHERVDKVVAVGHSLGGFVASALAVEHPGRIRAVVAV